VGGVSAVVRPVSIGIPKDSVLKYDTALKTDKYLLIVHALRRSAKAKNIIEDGHNSYTVHGETVLA